MDGGEAAFTKQDDGNNNYDDSIRWMAIELIGRNNTLLPQTIKSEVWAFGMVIYVSTISVNSPIKV